MKEGIEANDIELILSHQICGFGKEIPKSLNNGHNHEISIVV